MASRFNASESAFAHSLAVRGHPYFSQTGDGGRTWSPARDIDPQFNNTNEWWESIPEESRPRKDQPFYHLLAENETSYYVAYVSEQNLVRDDSGDPVDHPEVSAMFGALREGGRYDLDGHLH